MYPDASLSGRISDSLARADYDRHPGATICEVAGSQTALKWSDDDGLSYTVSGQLEADELITVAESIIE